MTMNKNDQEFLVQKIRTQYTEKEHTQLDELKELDKQVKRPANVFAYTFGTAGSLVLGTGMAFTMGELSGSMLFGVIIGLIGIFMVSINYPIYKKILASRKEKYASKILALSEKLMMNH